MEIYGGSIVPIATARERFVSGQAKSKIKDLQMLLTIPGHHTDFSNALLLDGDTTIDGDFAIDRDQKWVKTNQIAMIACLGNLTIKGDLINAAYEYWPIVLVSGNLTACNLVKGSMPLVVAQDVNASGYVVPQFNDGPLRIGGKLRALGYLPACKDQKELKGHHIAGAIEAPMLDLRMQRAKRELLAIVKSAVVDHDGVNIDKVIEYGKKGQSIWLSQDEAAAIVIPSKATPPPVPTPSPVDPISMGTIRPLAALVEELTSVTRELIPKGDWDNPYYFLEPLKWGLESTDQNILVLPSGTVIDGDLLLDWSETWVNSNALGGVVCNGDLIVNGTVLNTGLDGGPMLFVTGDLKAQHIVKGGAPLVVIGKVVASGLMLGEYNHGIVRVGQTIDAKTCIFLDHGAIILGKVNAEHYVNDHEHETVDFDDWRDVLVETAFLDEGDETPDAKLLWAHHVAGSPVFREDS